MPIQSGHLEFLRSTPHSSRLYLIVQQPQTWNGLSWDGYVWSGRVNAAPGTTDPITELSVLSNGAASLLDGMTVLISAVRPGDQDRGIFRLHGDQNIGAGNEVIYLAVTSELRAIQTGDYVVVLNEFRLWPRFPKVSASGTTITFYKDFGYFRTLAAEGLLWSQLGGSNTLRARASMPPVAVLGPHAVKFVEPGGTASFDFDFSSSYSLAPTLSVNTWLSFGEDGGAGWTDTVANPSPKTYSNISGMSGYRVTLEIDDGGSAPVWMRRGVRYVFTMRRPGQRQPGDPINAEPITDFECGDITGDWDSGKWRTSIRIFGYMASTRFISPGSLVIIFADDDYSLHTGYIGPSGTDGSVGPIPDRENIVFCGYVADGSIVEDAETGQVTFDVISTAEQANNRENYPVPIEDSSTPDEWYKTPSLTVGRAVWHYLAWHTTLPLIADLIGLNNLTFPIRAQEWTQGNILSSTIDSFLQDRRFAHIACDRYGRFFCEVDGQITGTSPVLFVLQDADWIGQIDIREQNQFPVSFVEGGGVYWNGSTATPYLSNAPGVFTRYTGRGIKATSLAVTSQNDLNTVIGRFLAAQNNPYPRATLRMAGNWRVGDIVPQEVVVCSFDTQRRQIADARFLLRAVSYSYDKEIGALFTTFDLEYETTGIAGVTVTVPELGVGGPKINTTPPKYPSFNGLLTWGAEGVQVSSSPWSDKNTGVSGAARCGFVDSYARLWRGQSGGGLYYSADGGTVWTPLTPSSDPPNEWGDGTPPVVSDLTYTQIEQNPLNPDEFFFLTEWKNSASDWRGWLLKWTESTDTWVWRPTAYAYGIDGYFGYSQATITLHGGAGTVSGSENAVGMTEDAAVWRVGPPVNAESWVQLDFGFTVPTGSTGESYFRRAHAGFTWTWSSYDFSTSTWKTQTNGTHVGSSYNWRASTPTIDSSRMRIYMGSAFLTPDLFQDAARWEEKPSDSARPIRFAIDDSGYIWITVWREWPDTGKNGAFQLQKRNPDTLKREIMWTYNDGEHDLYIMGQRVGQAVQAEMEAGDYVSYPFVDVNGNVYVYGLMDANNPSGSAAQVIVSSNQGQTFYVFEDGWGVDKCAAIAQSGSTIYAVRSGASTYLYSGIASLSLRSAIPFSSSATFYPDGIRIIGDSIGTAADGQVYVSDAPYATWTDKTDNHPAGAIYRLELI